MSWTRCSAISDDIYPNQRKRNAMEASEWFMIGLSLGLMPTLHVFGKWLEERRRRMSLEADLQLVHIIINCFRRR